VGAKCAIYIRLQLGRLFVAAVRVAVIAGPARALWSNVTSRLERSQQYPVEYLSKRLRTAHSVDLVDVK
jgi:hypothetical protein